MSALSLPLFGRNEYCINNFSILDNHVNVINIFDHVVYNKTRTLSVKHGRTKDTEYSKPQMSQHCFMVWRIMDVHKKVEQPHSSGGNKVFPNRLTKEDFRDREEMATVIPGVYVCTFFYTTSIRLQSRTALLVEYYAILETYPNGL